jgi:hypothetical protein
MCRPSCCKQPNEGAGIAAVAIIAASAVIAVKIGPVVARILHLVIEVLTIVMLTAASALAAIVLAWVTVRIASGRTRQHHARQQATLRPVPSAAKDHPELPDGVPGCLACGDTGTVLRAIGRSRYQAAACPACDPVTRAG